MLSHVLGSKSSYSSVVLLCWTVPLVMSCFTTKVTYGNGSNISSRSDELDRSSTDAGGMPLYVASIAMQVSANSMMMVVALAAVWEVS